MGAPDIRYSALNSETGGHQEGEDNHAGGNNEYDLEDFRLAVAEGKHSDGETLSGDMPRWKISDEDLADLFTLIDQHAGAMAAPVPRRAIPYRHFPDWRGPTEEPLGIRVAHVDASTAHRHAKIVMPESSMKGNSRLVDEKARPGAQRQLELLIDDN
jgi:hypothetical protein